MKKIGGNDSGCTGGDRVCLVLYYYIALPAVNIHSTRILDLPVMLVSCAVAACYAQEKRLRDLRSEGIERIKSDSYGSCSDRRGISVGISSFLSDSERKEISKAYESGRPESLQRI